MKRGLLAAVVGLSILSFQSCRSVPARQDAPAGTLAILGAFDQEVLLLEKMLVDAQPHLVEGITFTTGRLDGKPVVVGWTGVGKVNAAMTTTLLIEHYRPSRVIFTGIAGAVDPNLEPGDIVIGKRTAHHDMGVIWTEGLEHGGVKNRLTGDDNPVFFPADPNLLAAARAAADQIALDPVALRAGLRRPKIVVGVIVTGDTFVASADKCKELAEKLDADAVEMEGAAVAQICYQRNIGCLVIRSMSDKADESAVVDKQVFYGMAAKNLVALVEKMVEHL